MPSRLTFTWNPDRGSTLTEKPNAHVTKFGDGYELRTANGMNSNAESWAVAFTLPFTGADALLAFLRARNGVESFYWQNLYGATNVYVCRTWQVNASGAGHRTITCTLEQVFEA
jgi:phage-related protein